MFIPNLLYSGMTHGGDVVNASVCQLDSCFCRVVLLAEFDSETEKLNKKKYLLSYGDLLRYCSCFGCFLCSHPDCVSLEPF